MAHAPIVPPATAALGRGSRLARSPRSRRLRRISYLALLGLFVLSLGVCAAVPLSPAVSLVKTIGFALTGRLRFPADRIGETVTDQQGRSYQVFKQVIVDPSPTQPVRPGARLTLHFKVTNLSPTANQIYAMLPLPLYLGDPGFRSKLFTINGADCQSIYEWDTLADAQNYVNSVALKTIYLRSVPGSVTIEIEPLR